MPPETAILVDFADKIRPVQAQAQLLMRQAKLRLIAAGLSPEQASDKLARTLSALIKEL